MTRNSTHQTIIRHWKLLSKLPLSYPGITAAQITEFLYSEGYEISKRTVERDLLDLEQFFALRCNDKGKPYGWFWPEDSRKRFFLTNMLSNERQLLSYQHEPLYQKLHPHDFSILISQLGQGFVGRRWLFERISDWLRSSLSPILVVNGIAGIGKSAIAARLIKQEEVKVAGNFFCRFQKDLTPDAIARDFVQTLAHQLAEKYPSYRNDLVRRLSTNPQLLHPETPLLELFEQIITHPMNQIAGVAEPAIIIIDALDEATGKNGYHPLADLLVLASQTLPAWLRVIVTTRPTIPVQQRLGSFETQTIAAKSESNLKDLNAYAETQISPLISDSERSTLIDEIIEKSGGSFLYVTAIAHTDNLETLKRKLLPASMDDFLRANFERFYPDAEKFSTLQAPLLSLIMAFPKPLPEVLGSQILGITEREWINRLQPMLGSLLIKEDDGYQPFHRCLIDWLANRELSWPYTVDLDGRNKITDFLVNQLISPEWTDLPPEQRGLTLSSLPKLIENMPQWQDAELLMILAKRLHKAYQYHDEAPVVRRILTLAERMPFDNAQTILALCQSAANRRCLGDPNSAFVELKRAKLITEKNFSKPNLLRIEVYRQFGLTSRKVNDFNAAGGWYIKAIEESQELTSDEVGLAELLNNAGRMLMYLPTRKTDAEDLLRQSLQIRSRIFGEKHPIYGATLNNLGYLCLLDNRLEEAEKIFLQALSVKQMRDTGYDESVAIAEANLGSVYLRMGKEVLAEYHFMNALRRRTVLYGRSSIPVAKTLEKLGKTRLELQRSAEALDDFKLAVKIYETNLALENLSTLEAKKLVVIAQLKTGQRDLAQETAQEIFASTCALGDKGKALNLEVKEILLSNAE